MFRKPSKRVRPFLATGFLLFAQNGNEVAFALLPLYNDALDLIREEERKTLFSFFQRTRYDIASDSARVFFTKARRIFCENIYDFTIIFTQPLQADSTDRLRDNGDVIEIFVEYPSNFREQYSSAASFAAESL